MGSIYTTENINGHIFFDKGKPKVSVAGMKDFTVTYVKMTINRTVAVGNYNGVVKLTLRQSPLKNSSGSFSSAVLSTKANTTLVWNYQKYGTTTTITGNDGDSVCKFIESFLKDSSMNSLCMYNGEKSVSSTWKYCSANYAGATKFTLEFKVKAEVEL